VIREGREGVLAEPRDPHSLAKAIERLTSDRKAWQAMSLQAVQRHRERFTDEHMARSVAKAYRSMLD
jgi:glycosyltransferase involved in cell wall biosynthesis